jgi:hypothetical protein
MYFDEQFIYQNMIGHDTPLNALLNSVKKAHALIRITATKKYPKLYVQNLVNFAPSIRIRQAVEL